MTEYIIQQIINALSVGSEYALLALGLAIVYSIVGLVNFAHGEMITVAGFAMYFAIILFVPNPWLLLAIGLVVATITAVVFERVAFRAIRNAPVNTGMLTAFGVSIIIQNAFVIFVATRPRPVQSPAFLGEQIFLGPIRLPVLQVLETGVTLVAILALVALLRFTTIGLAMRAAAKDFTTVRLMGIRANRVIYVAFLISGFLAGIAAIFILSRRGAVDPFMGFVPVLKAFVACVVGGLGSLPGAVLGGLLLGVCEVFLQATLPAEAAAYRDALVFAVVGLILVRFSQGLLGRTTELGDKES
ncbi:branched-chain amino acid ABC transporter permease [Mesorhizobium sp. DCY119]|uniref:branched-chain amino acid ABC transporter permease n=1 Tax=Mesorhizobium sp. DCY119 TaxID=2108445 RepID=UPI000E6C8AD9|nr:branched-chain amino acid ABC transporter permease [Mesorhizobium sp. DCY119]RJG44390.1 branched-chain amino acid ABC transporter permease [Mesorhizobium sp. DCY119]